ncbi:MAG: putative lipid II flippase FtsW [Deltaproteobacteria bacterium]|nr:putative lipid II flippase FtsW [Deltaproteobacteria bacterium]
MTSSRTTRSGAASSRRWSRPSREGPVHRPGSYHALLTFSVLALLCVGVVMVYSSSAMFAEKENDTEFFLKKQMFFALLGVAAMVAAKNVDYRRLRVLAYPLLALAFVALVAVLIPKLGAHINGARRWIRLGPVQFQPAEYVKLALIVYLAYSLARKQEKIKSFTVGFLPHVMLVGMLCLLLLRQPDFGTSVVLFFILFAMLFVAGAKISYLLGAIMVAAPFAYHVIMRSEYRAKRMLAFLNPWEHRRTIGYQVTESLMTIGSGGMWGMGLGEGKQKLFFLPAAHTDFIFAIIGEEFGFAGIIGVALLFVLFVYSGIQIAMRAGDLFGMFLAFGVTAAIAAQAVVNMMVVTGLLPTKGFTLPFVSYGGSSLVITMAGVGLLQSVHAVRGTPPPVAADDELPAPVAAPAGASARVLRPLRRLRSLMPRGRNRRR